MPFGCFTLLTARPGKPYAEGLFDGPDLEITVGNVKIHRMAPLSNAPAATDAVRRAVDTQAPQLLAWVRKRCGTKLDARDVLQKAVTRALERSEQLRDPSRAEAWVGRIVRTVLIDELRKRREFTVAVDAVDAPNVDPGDIDCWCVLAQTERLKPEYALLLRRVIVDGIPVTQVAGELGLTPNNAMVRLHRARAALRARMVEHCGTTSARSCSECGCEERGCCAVGT
jgi:DNA-directed RNA polymerase specialized sigma24 family protein